MERRVLAGRYELLERLGNATWRAADAELGRDVLVRFGPVVGAGLAHPALAPVFDHGVEDGEPYAVEEYLGGGSLAERGELGEDAAAELGAGLAYAHSLGVVHGAVGAGTVVFDRQGRAKLTGFTGEGDPAADLAALEALRAEYGIAATAVRPAVPARVSAPPPRDRRRLVLLAAAVLLLFAAGLGAVWLATGSDEDDAPAASFGPITSATVGSTTEEDEQPAPPPTAPTTSEGTSTVTEPTVPAPTTERVPTVPTVPTAPTTPTIPTDPLPTLPTLPPTATTEELPPPPTDPA